MVRQQVSANEPGIYMSGISRPESTSAGGAVSTGPGAFTFSAFQHEAKPSSSKTTRFKVENVLKATPK